MNFGQYRASIERFGLASTAFHAAYRGLNRWTSLAVWQGMTLVPEDLDRGLYAESQRQGATLLSASETRRYADDPEMRLDAAFVDDAERKGDTCVALFDDGALVSYGWYSTKPTRLVEVDPRLYLHFSSSWVYMYNGFTAPHARGRRLHALGMAHAAVTYGAKGYEGLIGYVDASNFASLRSCHRLGYRDVGYLVMMKLGQRYACTATPQCARYGLCVKQVWRRPDASLREAVLDGAPVHAAARALE